MTKRPKSYWSEVLKYSEDPKRRQGSVRRHYLEWRSRKGIPDRCDNPACQFHTRPLVWNGKPLTLILDHADGNRRDNRPRNLQLLCPNCDSQSETRGGKNRGRFVEPREDRITEIKKDGGRSLRIYMRAAKLQLPALESAHKRLQPISRKTRAG